MKKVIYSAVIGAYDHILQPQVVAEDWDYVLFVSRTDNVPPKIGVWNVRIADHEESNDTLTSRYYKINPHVVLPQYDWHLWIDGNIKILDDTLYKEADERIASTEGVLRHSDAKHEVRSEESTNRHSEGDQILRVKTAQDDVLRHSDAEGEESRDYFGLLHPLRDDVAEEVLRTHRSGMISYRGAKKILRFLFKQEGLPRHSGLQEANIILRRNCPAIATFNALWWKMFLRFPPRDQFTQIYCLRKCGITPLPLLGEGINARNCPGLEVVEHAHHSKGATTLRHSEGGTTEESLRHSDAKHKVLSEESQILRIKTAQDDVLRHSKVDDKAPPRHSDAECNEAKNLVSTQILPSLRSLRITRAITRRLLALYIKRL